MRHLDFAFSEGLSTRDLGLWNGNALKTQDCQIPSSTSRIPCQ